ncbi:hypothetical protein CAEBREN_29936 [Caenorhabditis brenneri]|uniref:Uncharacterized protein n=1 Tax=Caenorhabditis brenneri TaxID=135651 RepID=G0PEQ3_CAEBE|nr:hypothetical protein CAEBREN_29936 [Caenorhabditis brenneri]
MLVIALLGFLVPILQGKS